MTTELLPDSVLYKLQSISFHGNRTYAIRLVKGLEFIEAICEVRKIAGDGLAAIDVIEFQSDEFNTMCTQGFIYVKPLSKAIFAFHECIYPASEL